MADSTHEINPHWQRVNTDKAMVLVDDALHYAQSLGAEILTVKAAGTVYGIYLKIHGREALLTSVPAQLFPAVISRIKIVADLDITSSTIQHGATSMRIGGRDVQMKATVSGSGLHGLAILTWSRP